MKTWIKRTLFGLFGAGVAVAGLSACWHQLRQAEVNAQFPASPSPA